MKVLHICVVGPYTDGWNYQENMLTKFQVKEGYEVSLIASQWAWDNKGKIERILETDYINGVGVRVFRLPIKHDKDVFYRYKRFIGFYDTIERVRPDIIFIHNLQFFDIDQIVKYAKEHDINIYADNHADFTNSARTAMAKLFYKLIWRRYAQKLEPYTKKFYGVLPVRVDFLTNIYGLPIEKCELLVMGGDDDLIEAAKNPRVKEKIRKDYGIEEKDFLIVTGGKIDEYKTQTLFLMEAIQKINDPKVKLIVFGSVADSLKKQVFRLLDGVKVQYIGWVESEKSYEYFAAADLVVFPGRHSVFWEQVVAMGIPMICKYWQGTTHIDCGGNVKFLKEDSVEEIQRVIQSILDNPYQYKRMLHVAQVNGKEIFSYMDIAKRSIK